MAYDDIQHAACNLGISKREVICRVMKDKLARRQKDAPERIRKRARLAYEEMSSSKESDYVIVNPYGEDDKRAWGEENDSKNATKEPIPGVQFVIDQFLAIVRKYQGQKILLILCGPSCVGKGPLAKAFFKHVLERKISVGKPTLYVSIETRPRRNGEKQGDPYHFWPEKDILKLDPKRYCHFDVRGVKQALDLEEVDKLLEQHDIVFLEIYYTALPALREWEAQHK